MISVEQIAALARIYGEFHGAIDPTEAAALEANENSSKNYARCIPHTLRICLLMSFVDTPSGSANSFS